MDHYGNFNINAKGMKVECQCVQNIQNQKIRTVYVCAKHTKPEERKAKHTKPEERKEIENKRTVYVCAKHIKPEEPKETKSKRRICEWEHNPLTQVKHYKSVLLYKAIFFSMWDTSFLFQFFTTKKTTFDHHNSSVS